MGKQRYKHKGKTGMLDKYFEHQGDIGKPKFLGAGAL